MARTKVDGRMVPLKYRLKSGDSDEILTSKTQSPSKNWLNLVKTSRARNKIKQWLLKQERDHNSEIGKDIFEKTCRVFNTSLKALIKKGDFERLLKTFRCKLDDDLYVAIAVGKLDPKEVLESLVDIEKIQDEQAGKEKLKEISSYSQKLTQSVRKKSFVRFRKPPTKPVNRT
jgi:GTP pyrophosphokinase